MAINAIETRFYPPRSGQRDTCSRSIQCLERSDIELGLSEEDR